MKVTIAGITYEGTYEEITKIVDRMEIKIEGNPYMPLKEGFPADWLVRYPKQPDTVTRTATQCKNVQCFCDGSCIRPSGMTNLSTTMVILDQEYCKNNK